MILSKSTKCRETLVRDHAVALSISVNGADEKLRGQVEKLVFEQLQPLGASELEALRQYSGGSIVARLVDRRDEAEQPAGIFAVEYAGRSAVQLATEITDLILEALAVAQRKPKSLRSAEAMRSALGIATLEDDLIDPDWAKYRPDDSADEDDGTIDPAFKRHLRENAGKPEYRQPRHSVEVNRALDQATRDMKHGERVRALAAMDATLTLERVPEAVEAAQRAFAGL